MTPGDVSELRCPDCQSNLIISDDRLECSECPATYPIEDGIIDLLDDSDPTGSSWKLRQFFEWITPFYQSIYFPFLYRLGTYPDSHGPDREAEKLVDRLGTTGGTVLDVACGPGLLTRKLATVHENVYGLDLSRSMLRRARSQTPESLSGKTHFVRADALNLPFAPSSLDALTCSGALYFFPSLRDVLDEFAKVMRREGRLAGMTVVREGILSGSLNRLGVQLYQFAETFRVYELEELIRHLEAAGFRDFNYSIHGCVVLFDATFAGGSFRRPY